MKELLTNRKPSKEYERDVELKSIVHEKRMNEQLENDVEFTEEIFEDTLKLLHKKGEKYNFIVKAGKSLHNALFKLFNVVWTFQKKPDSWRDSVVIQLDKKKNESTELEKKRHIHTKEQIPKFFGNIVANQIKPILAKNTSPFQIGGMPGHKNIFSL